MAITANEGPYVAFGNLPSPPPENNPSLGPSLFFAGAALLDPRPFYTYLGRGRRIAAWNTTSRITTLNAIPMTKSATIIAAAANTVSGTPMTLASTSVDGLAVGVTITRADTNVAAASLLKLDPLVASVVATIALGSNIMTVTAVNAAGGHCYNQLCPGMVLKDATNSTYLPTGTYITGWAANQQGTGAGLLGTYTLSAAATTAISGDTITGLFTGNSTTPAFLPTVAFGADGTVQCWNPADMSTRTLLYTCNNSSGTGGNFTANGFDVYGYPITETVTIAPSGALTIAGTKAFKFISSITPAFSDATYTYSVGTNDVVGLPLRSDAYQVGAEYDVSLMFNNAAIASSTGYLAAVLTTPTAITGDVRGTYALQTASSGTLRLVATQTPLAANLGTAIGLFGQPHYAAF